MAVSHWIVTFAFASVLLTSVCATMSKEIEDNKISIRFDEVDLKQWNADDNGPTDRFKEVVAMNASSYCADENCFLSGGGTTSVPFTVDDVMILSGYPKDENADVQIVFYISITNQDKPDSENQFALKKSALEAMLKDYKTDIASATGYEVVFIGDERVGAPLDTTLNTIIIPIAVGTLVLLILVTVCLHFREKGMDKKEGLVTNKRSEIPTNDTHGEGMVLTAMNKNSVKPQELNKTTPTVELEVKDEAPDKTEKKKGCREPRRKKKRPSSKNGEIKDGDTSSATTAQHIDVHPIPSTNGVNPNQQLPSLTGVNSSTNNSNITLPPLKTKRGSKSRSRQIEPPSYEASVGLQGHDGADDFLDDETRAVDREYLIKPSSRLPPLADRHSNNSSPTIEL